MGWWGKVTGGTLGAIVAGPVGAVLGVGLGHHLDREVDGYARAWFGQPTDAEQRRRQANLITAEFSLAGHLAKAGGLSPRARRVALDALAGRHGLVGPEREAAMALFEDGLRTDFPFTEVVNQARREVHRRPDLPYALLERLLYFIHFDARPSPEQRRGLAEVARRLGIPEAHLERFEREVYARLRGARPGGGPTMDLAAAYALLEVAPSATDLEVKHAYRRQMSRHHPDKLEGQGLPPERLAEAAARTHRIRKAYETVRAARGW
jgi:DnaJ like chaperone protein